MAKITKVKQVRQIVDNWVGERLKGLSSSIQLGLPEVDDRYDVWRVSLLTKDDYKNQIGEIQISMNGDIKRHTSIDIIKRRIEGRKLKVSKKKYNQNGLIYPSPIPNKVILGDSAIVLEEFPPDTAQLVISSPPYYNAKPEYAEYVDYQEYLDFLRKVFIRVHATLSEGRFFIINVSPVLIRRSSRNTSSQRIPIPFDIHKILESIGFCFIDDIIWVKPEGAGWNTGRGRRFAADRQPLQYKPVPVTEYVLVYRKSTDKLIDWNIRKHYNKDYVNNSKIRGDYDITNVWHITPGHNKHHPAVFPDELVEKLIRYYSFIDDLVLDPFAGSGTVGRISLLLNRRFLLIDNEPKYFRLMKKEIQKLMLDNRVDFEISDEYRGEYNDC